MLIMWRRPGESLLIGDNVEVEILEARSHKVKIGLSAPDSVAIVRKEAKLTRDENVMAAIALDTDAIKSLLGKLTL